MGGDRDSLEGWIGVFPSSDVSILTDSVLTLKEDAGKCH